MSRQEYFFFVEYMPTVFTLPESPASSHLIIQYTQSMKSKLPDEVSWKSAASKSQDSLGSSVWMYGMF